MNSNKRGVYKPSVQLEKNVQKLALVRPKFSIPTYDLLPARIIVKGTSSASVGNENVYSSSAFKAINQFKLKSNSKVDLDVKPSQPKNSRVPLNDLSVNKQNILDNVFIVKRSSILIQNSTIYVVHNRKRSKSISEDGKGKILKWHPRSKSVSEDKGVCKNHIFGQLNTPLQSQSRLAGIAFPATTKFVGNAKRECKLKTKEFVWPISPIMPNTLTKVDTFITEQLFISKRKPKIKKSYAVNDSYCDTSFLFDSNLGIEYLEDNFRHSLYLEDRQLLKPDFMWHHNHNVENRMRIINWMFKVQGLMKLPDNEIYISIYIFDKVLACSSVPLNMYQLVAATAIWITNKMENINSVQLSNLLSLCGNGFVQAQMCRMEQKILKLLKFKLCISEPTFFVSYALRLLNLETNELISHCAHFLIDCFALHSDFSSTPGSTLSFASVNTALRTFHKKNSNFFEYVKMFDDIPDLTRLERKIEQQMIMVKTSADICAQLKAKYSNAEKMEVFKSLFSFTYQVKKQIYEAEFFFIAVFSKQYSFQAGLLWLFYNTYLLRRLTAMVKTSRSSFVKTKAEQPRNKEFQ